MVVVIAQPMRRTWLIKYIIRTTPLSLANWLCLYTQERKGGCLGDHRGEYKVWEVRIEERNAWRVRSKEKVGIAYVALSVWVQQSGCQKEGKNIDKG